MSSKDLFQDQPLAKRQEMLDANAYLVEEADYHVVLSEEESAEMKTAHTQLCIQESRHESKLKAIKDQYKEILKPIKKEKTELLEQIKLNARSEHGKIFMFDDQDNGVMNTYNGHGQFIASRPLKPNERQLSINHAKAN